MKILITYYSRGSTVHTVAQAMAIQLVTAGEVTTSTIEPQTPHSYWGWLLRSLLPHYRVPIKPTITELASYDQVCLGFPKWTFACPPVNEYIRIMKNCDKKSFALFMCHRGFDEKRYLENMVMQISKRGALVIATLSTEQNSVKEGTYHNAFEKFCSQINSHLCGHLTPQ